MFGDMLPPFFLLVLLLLTLVSASGGQSYSNITRGTTLTAGGSPNSWLSPSGDFAFGFFPDDSNSAIFILAVWFAATSPRSVVWYANPRSPTLPPGATVSLTGEGRLSLRDETGTETWSAGAGNAVAASILDTGNLELSGTAGVLWESFDVPTDTLLPGQVLPAGASLRSQLTDANFSEGRFSLVAQDDGNLVLYPLALPVGNQHEAYWSTGTSGAGNELVYNAKGSIYYSLGNGTTVPIPPSGLNYPPESFYQRARLDPDGVFRQYVYPKNSSAGSGSLRLTWNVVARTPEDICRAINSERPGSGACGFNSYCSSDGGQNQINCMCPPGYSFIDPNNTYLGCMQNFVQSCKFYEQSSFTLIPVDNLDWPRREYEHYTNVDERQCSDLCLQDCFCAVSTFYIGGQGCSKKKLPLTYGRIGSDINSRALIKVSRDNSSVPVSVPVPVPFEENYDQRQSIRVVGGVLLGSSGLLNLILVGTVISMIVCSRRNKSEKQKSVTELNLRTFSYKELEQATKEFKKELGRGAFGIVYKGELPSSSGSGSGSGKLVAVKRLDRLGQMIDDGGDKEFTNEVRSIGQTHHKNLVKLIGYCDEGSQRLLVYEYMSRGSLQEFLFGGERPPWEQRSSIAMGIARGLMYLHEDCSAPIIHCDIKPQNVLLDDNLVARIADFGLAKLLGTDQTRTNTGIRGTRGYVAPEWFKSVAITKKVDVYSFGVMLLEIVSCRKNLEMEKEEVEEAILVYWAYDCYKEGRLDLLLRDDEDDRERVERFVTVAIWCIQEDPGLRPSMSAVVRMLEGGVPVAVPPDPSTAIQSMRQ